MLNLFRQTDDDRRRELLSSYIDGELTDDEAREAEGLLASSDDARQELAGLEMSVALLGQLPELDLPRSFKLDVLPEEQKIPWWSSRWATGLATSMATMLLIALVAGDMLDVLTQTRAVAIERMDSAVTEQAASAAAFASNEPAETESAPATAPQAAVALLDTDDSAQATDKSPVAPAVVTNGSSGAPESTANVEPPAVAPVPATALATDSAEVSASANEAEVPSQPETTEDTQASAGPKALTLAAPSAEGLAAQDNDPDAPVPAPMAAAAAAPAGVPGITSFASESADAAVADDGETDDSAKTIEEPVVSASAPAPARALPPPSAETSQSVDDQALPASMVEGSDTDAVAVASAPVPSDTDEIGAVPVKSANTSIPVEPSVESQGVERGAVDPDATADNGIELPLRQLQIAAAVSVLLLATVTLLFARRRRTSVV